MNIDYGNVFCSFNRDDHDKIRDSCRFKREIFTRGNFGMNKDVVDDTMIKSHKFLTGLLSRVIDYCNNKNIPVEMNSTKSTRFLAQPTISLTGITLRPDQSKAIYQACTLQRGIIKAPTGSGKTVVAAGICATFPLARILFLCHTLDLLTQTYDEFNALGLKNVLMLGGGKSLYPQQIEQECIVVATIQTLHQLEPAQFKNFDVVIVDECHHVTAGRLIKGKVIKSSYASFLESVNIPIRIGLTATPPSDQHKLLFVEGYLGPMIAELTIEEGMKMGIIARPIIDLIPVPYITRIGELKSYRDIYRQGIIENKTRNHLILEYAFDAVDKELSVLILTGKETDHGHILKQMAADAFDREVAFLYGLTSKEKRTEYKNRLKSRELKIAIANIIWYEGVNIPPIDIIINAEGGRASGKTLQKVGRGLRTAEGKDKLIIVDFLDPYKYLSHHCVLRLNTYAEQGWLKPSF